MFDLPDPFNPVIALNSESQPEMTVLVAYDLKPSMIISWMYIGGEWQERRSAPFSRVPIDLEPRF